MKFIKNVARASAFAAAMLGAASFAFGQAKGGAGGTGGTGGTAGAGASGQAGTGQAGAGARAGTQTNVGGVNQTPWFSNPQVRQHLNLTSDQYNNLNKAYQSSYANYQQGMKGLNPNTPAAERDQKMNELQQGFYKNFNPASDKYLPDQTQRQRYNQLHLQYQGYNAFNNPEIADKLNLTQNQREKMNQYNQEWNSQLGKFGTMYKTNPSEATKQFQNAQTQNNDRINSVLTPQQQTMWRQMTGNPYSFSPDIYFGARANTGAGTNPGSAGTQGSTGKQ